MSKKSFPASKEKVVNWISSGYSPVHKGGKEPIWEIEAANGLIVKVEKRCFDWDLEDGLDEVWYSVTLERNSTCSNRDPIASWDSKLNPNIKEIEALIDFALDRAKEERKKK